MIQRYRPLRRVIRYNINDWEGMDQSPPKAKAIIDLYDLYDWNNLANSGMFIRIVDVTFISIEGMREV